MLYRKFGKTGEKVSVLGFGCMRLTILGSDPSHIDEEKAIRMIRHAIDAGVNYVDTAYPYHGTGFDHGGSSELLVAKALKDGYRERVRLATKLPSWLIKSRADMDKYLNEQLERLQTKSIDFYLVHSLNKGVWKVLTENGIGEFLDQAIQDGRIKYAGFSFHDQIGYSRRLSTIMIGRSAKSNIIIWMKIIRPVRKDWSTQRKKAWGLPLWNPCVAAI